MSAGEQDRLPPEIADLKECAELYRMAALICYRAGIMMERLNENCHSVEARHAFGWSEVSCQGTARAWEGLCAALLTHPSGKMLLQDPSFREAVVNAGIAGLDASQSQSP